jgi:hypothetical protein
MQPDGYWTWLNCVLDIAEAYQAYYGLTWHAMYVYYLAIANKETMHDHARID